MKFTAAILSGLIPFALAQELGPAPTESYGCEPHGDHYHCEGHVSETAAEAPQSTGDDHDHDHDHEDEETGSLPPSPTASTGCEPHGDHWHCEGPAETASVTVTTTESLPPSPTASVGCEPHGDHWHCEGPAEGASGTVTSGTVTTTESLPPSPTASVGCEPHGDHWHCEGPAEGGDEEETGSEPTPTGGVAAQVVPLAGAALAAALAL